MALSQQQRDQLIAQRLTINKQGGPATSLDQVKQFYTSGQAGTDESGNPNYGGLGSWDKLYNIYNSKSDGDLQGSLTAAQQEAASRNSTYDFVNTAIGLGGAFVGAGSAGLFGGAEGAAAGAGAGAVEGTVPMAQGGPMDWANTYAGGSPENFYTPETGGGFTNSIMNNPYAGGGLNMDYTGAGLGNLSAGTGGIGAAGPMGAGAAAGAAEGGTSLFDTISDFLKTPIGGAVGNAGTSLLTGGMLRGLANKQANYSSLDQSQRQPYQGNLSQLVNNPSSYLNTDPFAKSLAAMYRDKIIPRSIAQSGNPGQVLDEKGSQFVNALTQNYNTQMGNLSGIAGFGFPQSQYAGYGAGQIGVGAASQIGNAVGGLGNAFGKDFSKIMQGQAGTSGPFGTSIS